MERKNIIYGLRSGSAFFKYVSLIGLGIIGIVAIMTSLFFWINIAITSPIYLNTSIFMLRLLQFGIIMAVTYILKSFLNLIADYLYIKEIKLIEQKEIHNATNKRGTKAKKDRVPAELPS